MVPTSTSTKAVLLQLLKGIIVKRKELCGLWGTQASTGILILPMRDAGQGKMRITIFTPESIVGIFVVRENRNNWRLIKMAVVQGRMVHRYWETLSEPWRRLDMYKERTKKYFQDRLKCKEQVAENMYDSIIWEAPKPLCYYVQPCLKVRQEMVAWEAHPKQGLKTR